MVGRRGSFFTGSDVGRAAKRIADGPAPADGRASGPGHGRMKKGHGYSHGPSKRRFVARFCQATTGGFRRR